MSAIVYKQRHYSSNKKTSARDNFWHVKYIARRDGAVANEFMTHGLWGSINGEEIRAFDSDDEIALRVKKLTPVSNIYRGIISLSEFASETLNLNSNESWQDWVKDKVHILAKENDIPLANLEFACAYHHKSNEHLHIIFWDRDQKILKNFVAPERVNAIRRKLIQASFSEELRELYEKKDLYKKLLREETSTFLRSEAEKPRQAIFRKIRGKEHEKTIEMLTELIEVLPKKGRLDYKYLDVEAKKKLDELVSHISGTKQIKKLYNARFEILKEIDDFYGGSKGYRAKLNKKHENEMNKWIANTIMGEIKRYYLGAKPLSEVDKNRLAQIERERIERLAFDIIQLICHNFPGEKRQGREGRKNKGELSRLMLQEIRQDRADKSR